MAPYGFDETALRHLRFKGQSGTYAELTSPPSEMDAPANDTMAIVFRVPAWVDAAASGFDRIFDNLVSNTGVRLQRFNTSGILSIQVGNGSSNTTLMTPAASTFGSPGEAHIHAVVIENDVPTASEIRTTLYRWSGSSWTSLTTADVTSALSWGSGNNVRVGNDQTGAQPWDDRLHFVQVWEGGLPGQGGRRLINFNPQDKPHVFDWSASPNPTYTDKRGLVQDGALRLGSVVGQHASATGIQLAPSGDFEVEIEFAASKWLEASAVYALGLNENLRVRYDGGGGGVVLEWYTNSGWTGTNRTIAALRTVVPFDDGETVNLRWRFDVSEGDVQWFLNGVPAYTHNKTGPLPLVGSAGHTFYLGANPFGLEPMSGSIERLRITDLTTGQDLVAPDATTLPDGTTSFVDSVGNPWTVPALSDNVIDIIGGDFANVNPERVTRVEGVRFAGDGARLASPDSATVSLTGDLGILARLRMGSWSVADRVVIGGKWDGGARSYAMTIEQDDTLCLLLSADGSYAAGAEAKSTVTLASAVGSAQEVYVWATRRASDHRVQFWWSTDRVNWTQLGADVTHSITSVFDSVAEVSVGDWFQGNGNNDFKEDILEFTVLNGLTLDNPVFRYDGTDLSTYDQMARIFTDTVNGAVITVEGDAVPLTYPLVTRAELDPKAADGNADYPGRWADISGHGHDAVRNGPIYNAAKRAWEFDGVDDYFEIPESDRLDVGAGESATWVSLVDVDAEEADGIILAKRGGFAIADPGVMLRVMANGSFQAEISDGTTQRSANGSVDSRGKKVFAALVIDRGTNLLSLYLDGALANSTSISTVGDLSNGHPVRFGQHSTGGSAMGGLIHRPPFFRYALPPQEIQELTRYLTGKRSRAAMALALRMI